MMLRELITNAFVHSADVVSRAFNLDNKSTTAIAKRQVFYQRLFNRFRSRFICLSDLFCCLLNAANEALRVTISIAAHVQYPTPFSALINTDRHLIR